MPRAATKRKVTEANSTDEDEVVNIATVSKKGRKINPNAIAEPKLNFDLEWLSYGEETSKGVPPLYYLYSETLPSVEKIAAFDIDNTIIVTKSGKNFAINNKDWTWFDKCVPQKLKELNDQGFRVVFITNQAGIEKGKVKFSDLKIKFQDIISQLDNVPVFILISTGETHYRKPATEMWSFLINHCNKNNPIDISKSYYVGDAAGRAKNWAPGKPKDFSCSDRMFAHNCNLGFYTPEEFFLSQKKQPFEWGSVDPNEILKKHSAVKIEDEYHVKEQEMVLFVGPPASGKSSFSKRYFQKHNYVSINRDTLQTPAKCLKATETALKEGKSVCIDNTNPSRKARAEYINLAKKFKVNVRCFLMKTPIELCHHLNYFRQNQTKSKVRRIPDVGYNVYKSQFEQPDLNENISKIIEIDFHPKFDATEDENMFKQWT